MTREQASALLDVSPEVGAEELRRRYETLHNDYQVRLTNAPTPNLKKAYQKNLQELREACETLHPGFVIAAAPDLPSVEPVQTSAPVAVARPRPGSLRQAEKVETDGGWPRSTMFAGAAAVVVLALGSLFLVLWLGARQRESELATVASKQTATVKALEARVAADDHILQNGKLEVCNRSTKSVEIASAVVMYRESDGKMKTVHSGSYGYPTWTIQASARGRIQVLRGQPDDWDGSAAFYALQVIYQGAEPFVVTGLMSEAKEGCVNLYLD
jgi:hypothetical protein